jgi:transcriptional regulator with XRE-family HTH domain
MALTLTSITDLTLGEMIFLRRKEMELDQAGLGELCGASRQLVSKWEHDLSVPDLWQAVRLADALGVDLRIMVALAPDIRPNRARSGGGGGSLRSRCSADIPVAA